MGGMCIRKVCCYFCKNEWEMVADDHTFEAAR